VLTHAEDHSIGYVPLGSFGSRLCMLTPLRHTVARVFSKELGWNAASMDMTIIPGWKRTKDSG
jgi:hypothetical protein